MKPIKEVLAENLIRYIQFDGRKLDDIAEAAGLPKRTIEKAMYKESWPEEDTVQRIAGALGIEETRLFFDEDLCGEDTRRPTISDAALVLLAYEKAPLKKRKKLEKDLGIDAESIEAVFQRLQSQSKPSSKES